MSIIDMVGKPCPIPVIEAKKALRGAASGDSVTLLVDNDVARRNLEKMASGLGHGSASQKRDDGNILVTITAGAGCRLDDGEAGGLVVAIGRETMGSGSDELGRMLMKSYIHSLTELDAPPEQLLLFNGGVMLSSEGSSVLEDLELLSEKCCVIASCGACLNYYGLSEKLKIGSITNMYAIAEAMGQAKKLVNM